ncbi:MAG: hypothetical protein U1E22_05370, partial [Coriobacteriia bacterium]|nr:hypothetical protein [Coriobacteriia bacterium]
MEEVHAEALPALGPVVELALARQHGCARMADGSARCWGTNGSGEVGDGTRERRAVAVGVANTKNLEQIVVGPEVGCARTKEGRVLCWGRSDRGQTAGGPEDQLVPLEVPAVNGVTHIATDQSRTCAVAGEGRVACWGPGISQPGRGVVWREGMEGSGSITASGRGVVCSALVEGGAACFGDDEFGQLGIGRSLQR